MYFQVIFISFHVAVRKSKTQLKDQINILKTNYQIRISVT